MIEKLYALESRLEGMRENIENNGKPILEKINVELERAKKIYDTLINDCNNPNTHPYVKEYKNNLLNEVCELSQSLTLRKKALELEMEKFDSMYSKLQILLKEDSSVIKDEDINFLEEEYNDLMSTIRNILIQYLKEEFGGNN